MRLTASRTVSRPADEVFAFVADAANNPRWQQGMVACTWTSEPPIAVGSTYEQRARFMGRPVISTFEVTRLEPGRLIEIDTIESTFPIRVVRSVEPLDEESCRIAAEISGGPGGLMRILEPLMASRAQKSVDADYDRLVQLLEA